MASDDDAGVVREWITAIDERRFEDALEILGDGWVDHGPGGFAFDRDAFLATADAMFGDNDLRLTIRGQVANNGHVATQLSWADDSQQMDVLRLARIEAMSACPGEWLTCRDDDFSMEATVSDLAAKLAHEQLAFH